MARNNNFSASSTKPRLPRYARNDERKPSEGIRIENIMMGWARKDAKRARK